MVESRETAHWIISLLSTNYALSIKNLMKNIFIIFLLALALGVLAISSCSKDEPCMDETNKDCPNFNPCT
jgi:hypothetical protein